VSARARSFHAAEYPGSFSDCRIEVRDGGFEFSALQYSLQRKRKSGCPGRATLKRLTICCKVIGDTGIWRRPAERGLYPLPRAAYAQYDTIDHFHLDAPPQRHLLPGGARRRHALSSGRSDWTGKPDNSWTESRTRFIVFSAIQGSSEAGGGPRRRGQAPTIYLTDLSLSRGQRDHGSIFREAVPGAPQRVAALPRGALVERMRS